jgi:hypothetical protein
MGGSDDAALRGLPEYLCEMNYRHGALRYDIGQYLSGPDRGKLVDVAHDQHGGMVGDRLCQGLHQHDVDADQGDAAERTLLWLYFRSFGETPPLNRSGAG